MLTNVRVCDLDKPDVGLADKRRIAVIAEGLPVCAGTQLAIDTTLVCTRRCDGSTRPRAVNEDCVVLGVSCQLKEL